MDTDTNQQINQFSKGMVADISDALLDDGQYRMAKNLRYVTDNEENTGELHMIEGSRYAYSIGDNEQILASTQIRNIGVVITKDGDTWRIRAFDNPYKESIGSKDFKPIQSITDVFSSTQSIANNFTNKLSLVTRWENDDNVKLYVADGEHPVMLFNLKQTYTTHDINSVTAYSSVQFKKPIFCGLIVGQLKAGLIEYSYQFYTKHGHQSEISPSTKLIPLHNGSANIDDAKTIEGYEQDKITNKGIRIKILKPADIDSGGFDHIKVFRITYVENGQLPMIEVIYDDKIHWNDNNETIIDDIGQKAIEVYSLEEYNSMTGIHVIPRVIESKNDYLFASNIKEKQANISDEIRNWTAEDNVSYNFVKTDLVGDYGRADDKIINSGGPAAGNNSFDPENISVSVLRDSWEDVTFDGTDYTQSNQTTATYANPAVSYLLKSLRRGETYRYGIILYDKDGNASPVKHIADITVPNALDNDFKTFTYDSNGQLLVHSIGLKFTVNDLPEDVVGYEIVRCGRTIEDTRCVSQGIISRPTRCNSTEDTNKKYPFTPTGLWQLYNFSSVAPELKEHLSSNWYLDGANYKIYQYTSPEICYIKDTTQDLFSEYKFDIQRLEYIYPTIESELITNKVDIYTSGQPDMIDETTLVSIDWLYRQYLKQNINWKHIGSGFLNIPYFAGVDVSSLDYFTDDEKRFFNTDQILMLTNLTTAGYYFTQDDLQKGTKTLDNPGGMPSGDEEFRYYKDINDRFAYIKLYNSIIPQPTVDLELDEIKVVDQPRWNTFFTINSRNSSEYDVTHSDTQIPIGGENYVNWVVGGMQSAQWSEGDLLRWNNSFEYLDDSDCTQGAMIGPGGRCAIFALKEPDSGVFGQGIVGHFGTYLCNIVKETIPYGGTDSHALETSSYNSYGDYYGADQNECYVFDGDTFIQPFEYVSQHKWYTPALENTRNACIIYSIPVETSINLAYTYGFEFSKNRNSSDDITNLQTEADNVYNKFTQNKDLYLYNSAYSVNNNVQVHSAQMDEDTYDELYTDYRTYFSNKKENNERADSWLKFMPANYLDVDTRYGEITGLRTFNNRLVFWQEEATGLFSVEERVQVTDENSNLPLILGTGGVLSRYDYMATSNGMHKNQFSDAQSDTTLYWWDYNKHEILGYSGGETVVSLSKVKQIQNMLNDSYNNNKLITAPMLAFDKRFNELIASVDQDRSIIYSEMLQSFQSVYDIQPEHSVQFADRLYLTKGKHVHEWNQRNGDKIIGFDLPLFPYLKYIVNKNEVYTKVFDNQEFAGRVYGGDNLDMIDLTFKTPLKQESHLNGRKITNREYNFRYAIPRHDDSPYGDRMRGKTMQCELKSSSNDYDFSLQWIKTKFRISWS